MRVVILGLSLSSSWGNGHATNFRALVGAMGRAGHQVLFLERDVPWYARNRDLEMGREGTLRLYESPGQLAAWRSEISNAQLVLIGSYLPDGVEVADLVLDWAGGVTAFYDIDTPVTLAALEEGSCTYLDEDLIPRFDLYLSFSGGPILDRLERDLGARRAEAFHCFVDPGVHRPLRVPTRWALGYLGTHSTDREEVLEELLARSARTLPDDAFVIAGPGHRELHWPVNIELIEHLSPAEHARFYSSQLFTLNVTREEMRRSGWGPSVRLFEAAACGIPVISDWWEGLDTFFTPGREIAVAASHHDVVSMLGMPEQHRVAMARRARSRVMREHTGTHRVRALERWCRETASAGAAS
ncbi:MAG: glycosyltransferase [Actinobacteria bacterium]|nr:glycosyltransferase [Actinomycetota bacterium]